MKEVIPSCFKAYDIRGKVPDELNRDLAYRIGFGLTELFAVKKVVVARDIRLSGREIGDAVMSGLQHGGSDVYDMGMGGTEEIYHAVFHGESEDVDCGVIVTASHNPADYNGMKIVMKGAKPLSGDSGLRELGVFASSEVAIKPSERMGKRISTSYRDVYIEHLLGYIEPSSLSPMTIVANSGNGCAGRIIDELEKKLPFTFIKLHHEPDGTFPNGVPNPLLEDKREETAQAVVANNANFGLAWDGDFDRCFFWDEKGRFVEGYYVVALLASELLKKNRGEKILHDPRLTWNTVERVVASGGQPIMTRTGHAFIKERMRAENGLYGGEMSAHHYFRDFGYCDSGMIPWLLVASLISREKQPLSVLVDDMMDAYPVSGEINSVVADADAVIRNIENRYSDGIKDYTDGLSVEYPAYRFNIRKSNTEPLLRLNVESRGDKKLLEEKTEELLSLIRKE